MTSERADTRRRFYAGMKAQVVAECDEPGASVAKVAMARGIDISVVRRWRKRACESLDMRAGTEAALARAVKVFGATRPRHAYPGSASARPASSRCCSGACNFGIC